MTELLIIIQDMARLAWPPGDVQIIMFLLLLVLAFTHPNWERWL